MRLVKGNDAYLVSDTFVAADGETPTATASTPTCSVTRADGTALTAPVVSAVSGQTGVYKALLLDSTHLNQLDLLDIVWSGTADSLTQNFRSQVDVVSARVLTIPQLRTERGLESSDKVPVSLLDEVLEEFEDLVEHYCGVAFVQRFQREELQGNGVGCLNLRWLCPKTLRSVTIDGTSYSTSQFTLHDHGVLQWENNAFPYPSSNVRNVVVEYEHGDAMPAKLRRVARSVCRYEVIARTSARTTNKTSETSMEGTTMRFARPEPEKGRPTGIRDLDAFINWYRGGNRPKRQAIA